MSTQRRRGHRLAHDCLWRFGILGQRPDESHNPARDRPTKQEVQPKNCSKIPLFPARNCREEIQTEGNETKDDDKETARAKVSHLMFTSCSREWAFTHRGFYGSIFRL